MKTEYTNYMVKKRGIADPWYSGRFDVTYKDVVKGCTAFLEYLKIVELKKLKQGGVVKCLKEKIRN